MTIVYFLLESLRNNWVGEEAVALNYFDTAVGGELDTTFTGALHNDDYMYADWIEAVETTKVTYAMMFGNTDRRLHTVDIDVVVDEDGRLWADSKLFETELC
tara:strand:+ start:111 stop:416 length:306 start_codon:yes stop_codon:yes gene_type:complete